MNIRKQLKKIVLATAMVFSALAPISAVVTNPVKVEATEAKKLPAPKYVKATKDGSGKVTVSWTKVNGAGAYKILDSKKKVLKVTNNKTFKTTIKSNTTNLYVMAKNSRQEGNSRKANSVKLKAPAGASWKFKGNNVVLNWSKVPGATAYQVVYKTSNHL